MSDNFSAMVDSELLNNFNIALEISGDDKDAVVDGLLKSYVSGVLSEVLARYDIVPDSDAESREYYGKALQKIPKWAKNSSLGVHRMIHAYIKLAEQGDVTYSELAKICSNPDYHPDLYVKAFATNFSQMKHDSKRSIGKVFEVNGGVVTLWSYVEPRIMRYKKDFLQNR